MSETTTPAEAQETEATSEFVTAKLGDKTLRVKTVEHWRPSYLRALRQGDYDTWAEGALHPEDVDAFVDADATFKEINEFTSQAMSAAGEAPGKSGGPSTRSTRTRKR
ncbi:hypothetical protein ABTY96_03410 [Streptomyces sp. NPDC096057]|uniref:hypothetical protein n=1 Tax=Streptomyces sp. NPDC096057 TaxID=3155543 RepID=UPI003329FE2B